MKVLLNKAAQIDNLIHKNKIINKTLGGLNLMTVGVIGFIFMYEPKIVKYETTKISHGTSRSFGVTDSSADTPISFEKPKALNENEKFIEGLKAIALEEQHKFGIPASIKIAQAVVESGWGKDGIAKEHNNYFGIKNKTDFTEEEKKLVENVISKKTIEYYNGKKVNVRASFVEYKSRWASIRHHSLFLRNRIENSGNKHYAKLASIPVSDYKKWAHGLERAGYSTNKNYAETLISIIERYGLAKIK